MDRSSVRNCPGCDSNKRWFAGTKNGFKIFVCTDCSSLYTSHLPENDEQLNYDDYYSEANLAVPDFVITRVKEIIGEFARYRQKNRLLDVGFGAGTILDVAKDQGWDAFGQEISAPAVEQARMKGFDVFCGDLLDAKYPDGHFDVVTCSEILEHVPNPHEMLGEVVRITRKGGMFWATTPSARGISFRLMGTEWSVVSPPEHTQLYSKRGISQMLSAAGFSSFTIKSFSTNPGEIRRYYRSRSKAPGNGAEQGFDRVQSSYDLNEKLSSSPARQMVKRFLNNSLNLFDIGDSLKIFAQR